MNNLDDLAWKREFDRVEAKQEKRKSKREGWDGKNQTKVYLARTRMVWDRDIFKVTDKDNNQ